MPDLPCSCVLLTDQKERQQHTYWIFELECMECLADNTVYYPDGTFKKILLDKEKIGKKAVFRVDVAESILRRNMLGIKLECVEAVDL